MSLKGFFQKHKLTRFLTGTATTDKALKHIYDKLNGLLPVIAKTESALIDRETLIGDTMLVQDEFGNDKLAVLTNDGWKVNINEHLIVVDGRNFRPHAGLRSPNNRVDKDEAITYQKYGDYAVNDILRWNGREFKASQEGLDLSFDWTKFQIVPAADTTITDMLDTTPTGTNTFYGDALMGTSGGNWTTTLNLDCTLKNFSDFARFESVEVKYRYYNGSTYSGFTDLAELALDSSLGDGASDSGVSSDNTVTLVWPTITAGASNTSTAFYDFDLQFKYKEDPTSSTQTTFTLGTTRIFFGNYKYVGLNASDAALNSSNVQALNSSKKVTYDMSTHKSPSMSTSVTFTDDDLYIHYWYPKRLGGTPTFNVGSNDSNLNPETWTSLGDSTEAVANGAGYTELYTGWRSPFPYNNTEGVTSWYVEVVHA